MTNRHVKRRGSTAVEYVLILSLIVGAVLLIAVSIGDQSKSVFQGLGNSLNHASRMPAEGEQIHGTADVHHGAAASPGPTSVAVLSAKTLGLVVLGLAVVGAAVALSLVRHRKTNAAIDPTTPAAGQVEAKPSPAYIAKRQQILRSLAAEGRRVLHNQLSAEQIMSRRVTTVLPSALLGDVRELMSKRLLRHILVCDGEGKLLGVISDRDLIRNEAGTARDIMTSDPITIVPETSANLLVSILLQSRISSLPVVRDGQVLGIVTKSDIAMTLQCTLQLVEQLVSDLEKAIEGKSFALAPDEMPCDSTPCALSA